MPPTLTETGPGIVTWTWANIIGDLERAGYTALDIDIASFTPSSFQGRTSNGNPVLVSWDHEKCFLLSMFPEIDKHLAQAFAKILGYEPFCRYIQWYPELNAGLPTFEWARSDAPERFAKLEKTENIRSLVRLQA